MKNKRASDEKLEKLRDNTEFKDSKIANAGQSGSYAGRCFDGGTPVQDAADL